jgi:hypothetical protein
MALLKPLFCERGLSLGLKPVIYDQEMTAHYFLLGGVTIGWTSGSISVLFVLLLQEIYHCSGTFSSVILLFFGCVQS